MLTGREDRIVEALLSQETVENDDFAGLSQVLATISREEIDDRIDEKAATFAEVAARMARSGEGGTARRIRPGHRPLIPRLAVAALALVLASGMTGVAVAADAARPGDFLYSIDRALERIGINDGGLDERIEEANELIVSGSPAAALNHIADSLDPVSASAADALEEAAEKVRDTPNTDSGSLFVREDVASMLEWMSDSNASGREFGQGVAERARDIGQLPAEPAGKPVPPPDPNSGRGQGEGGGNGNGPPGGSPPGQKGP